MKSHALLIAGADHPYKGHPHQSRTSTLVIFSMPWRHSGDYGVSSDGIAYCDYTLSTNIIEDIECLVPNSKYRSSSSNGETAL